MSFLGNRLRDEKRRAKEKRDRETRERQRLARLEARREWKERKPRPLLDLVKASTGLRKWLLLAGGAIYLFLHGNNFLSLFSK